MFPGAIGDRVKGAGPAQMRRAGAGEPAGLALAVAIGPVITQEVGHQLGHPCNGDDEGVCRLCSVPHGSALLVSVDQGPVWVLPHPGGAAVFVGSSSIVADDGQTAT